jgi:hypothetical protein
MYDRANAPRDNNRNPDSIPSRLEQAVDGLERNLGLAVNIREKLFGSTPQPIGERGNATLSEISVIAQIDVIQARIQDVTGVLEGILKSF